MSRSRFLLLGNLVVLVAVLSLSTACGSDRQEGDSLVDDLLNDRPCAIPCWQEIVPGQTTEQEAIDILSSRDRPRYVGRPRISHLRNKNEAIAQWKTKGAEMPRQVSSVSMMWMREGVVHHTHLVLDPGLTAQMVIEKWGEPQKVFIYVDGREYIYEWARFCYPDLGTEFDVFLGFGRSPLVLDPDDQVLFAMLYAPMAVEQWLDAPLDQDPWRVRLAADEVLDWPGFGQIIPR